jgi:uncharacterized membrane protein YeaQ/YmgE (transglycosylase-associated protein family)
MCTQTFYSKNLTRIGIFKQCKYKEMFMDWIVVIIVGALIGWLASIFMKTDSEQGPITNIMIGIGGAALGRWLLGDVIGLSGAQVAGSFSIAGIFWGVIGAVILIGLLRALRVVR